MSANSSQELLEPRLSPDRAREKLVRSLLVDKPEIFRVPGPGVLQQVKSFLPQMAEAGKQLNEAVARDGADKFNVEKVEDDENVIEMDIVLDKEKEKEDWTSDSDADSTPSPSENSYTSDTDISSSSTCSSSSCDETQTYQNK